MSDQNQSSLNKIAIPLFIVVLLLGGLFFTSLDREKHLVPSMRSHKPLPEFSAPVLFQNIEMNSKDIRGEYWLLNFWGSWCTTCYAEHPYLMSLKQSGMKIIGVNYKDSESGANKFLTSQGNPYEFSFFDPKGRLAIEMGITAAPETFLISPDGEVLYHRVGELNESVFNKFMRPLIQD